MTSRKTAQGTVAPSRIRMQFELDVEDDPELFAALIKVRQGSKRVTRLRLLAHDGLMRKTWAVDRPPGTAAASMVPSPPRSGSRDRDIFESEVESPSGNGHASAAAPELTTSTDPTG